MTTINRKVTLDAWIRDAMSDPDKDKPISQIVLVHNAGGTQKPLHTIKIGKKAYQPDQMAQIFLGNADAYCQSMAGVQTFQLLAFYGERTEPEKYMTFVRHGSIDNEGLGSEAPTPEGERRQSMRWTDNWSSQLFRRQGVLDETFIRLVEQQNRMIEIANRRAEQLAEENADAMNIVKQVMVDKFKEDHEARMKQLEYERSTKERAKLMHMAPPLINRITGREIFPQSTEDTALLEALANSLDEEAVMMLLPKLPQELTGLLMARFAAVIEKKQKEAAEAKKLAQLTGANHPNPEADAGGD